MTRTPVAGPRSPVYMGSVCQIITSNFGSSTRPVSGVMVRTYKPNASLGIVRPPNACCPGWGPADPDRASSNRIGPRPARGRVPAGIDSARIVATVDPIYGDHELASGHDRHQADPDPDMAWLDPVAV